MTTTRSASEWREFWRDRGERELAALLEELEPHATRIATLLGCAELAARVHRWFESA